MNNKILYTTAFISLLVFLAVTFIFNAQNGFMYDEYVNSYLANIQSSTITNLMEFISLIGSSEVILLLTGLIAFIFLVKRDWYHMFLFLIISVGGVFLNFILKMGFQRERPGGEMSTIEVFNYSLEIPSYSFPSGHTMRATILLLFLIYLASRFLKASGAKLTLYIVISLMMIGVAFSRLYLEAHFLSDTVAAISISITWFCICYAFLRKYDKRRRTVYHPVIGK